MSSARHKSGGSRKSGSKGRKKAPGTSTKEVAGLRTLVQKRLLHDVFTYCSDNFEGWMVLVVDKKAMRTISSAVGMYDIMERKVTIVEDIEKKRAPFKDMAAIYVLAPTEDSVNRMIEDFSGDTPLYGKSVFIYFLGRLSPKQLDKIKECRPLVKRIKALSEANIDFLAKELRAFHFDMRRDFTHMYVRRGGKKVENRIAEKLISVCSTLNEYPYIRFSGDSPVASAVGSQLAARLDNFVRNEDFWFHGDNNHSDRERATLIILDRKDDVLTPLMHDFTYQSMVKDLLDVKDDDKITLVQDKSGVDDVYEDDYDDSDWDEDDDEEGGGGGKKGKSDKPAKVDNVDAKDILLNEDDNVWVEMRGKHIAQVIEQLSDRCREMVNSDTSGFTNKEKGKTMSLTQMANALKALPEYKEVMAKLSQHMQIAHECMDEFNKKKLFDLSELEQTLATGEREDGSKPKLPELMDEVKKALKSMSDPRARLRLLLIVIVSQGGIKDEFRSSLYRAAKVDPTQEKMLSIMQENMDVNLQNNGSNEAGAFGKFKSAIGKQEVNTRLDADATFANSRYVPPLKHILEQVVENTLSTDKFPSARSNDIPSTTSAVASARRKPEGSARKGGATDRWQRSNQKEGNKDETYAGGRIIVFVVGGMSYAELRVTREVQAKAGKEVIAGSTIFSKPNDFLDDLRRLTGKRRESQSRESTKSSS